VGHVRFGILGPLLAEVGTTPVDVGGVKQRILLAALLLSPNQVVSTDRLVELLWSDRANERAKATLHVNVAKLRKTLAVAAPAASASLATVRPGYRLTVSEDTLDLLAFGAAVERARTARDLGHLDEASSHFADALRLPRGALLADLGDQDFVAVEAHRFDLTLVTVVTDHFDAELRLGRHAEILTALERSVDEHPLDERLCGLLMIALYRSGRPSDALERARVLRTQLREGLGTEPGPQLARLEQRVLRHDPSLAAPGGSIGTQDASVTRSRPSRTPIRAAIILDGERLPLVRSVTTIGRRSDRTIVVSDRDASRNHAEIRRAADGFLLVDVGSTNGTRVNGHWVRDHRLESGDEIEIGTTILRFEE
jgi:DNA-binding SARP family transcriptional activator